MCIFIENGTHGTHAGHYLDTNMVSSLDTGLEMKYFANSFIRNIFSSKCIVSLLCVDKVRTIISIFNCPTFCKVDKKGFLKSPN